MNTLDHPRASEVVEHFPALDASDNAAYCTICRGPWPCRYSHALEHRWCYTCRTAHVMYQPLKTWACTECRFQTWSETVARYHNHATRAVDHVLGRVIP